MATSGRLPMSGPELQANAIQSLMRGSPLKEPAGVVSAAWILLWSPRRCRSGRCPCSAPARTGCGMRCWARLITFGLLAALVAGLVLGSGWLGPPETYAVFGFVVSAFTASSMALARTRAARSCATASAASSRSRRSTP